MKNLRERFEKYTNEELQLFNGDNDETLKNWTREDAIEEAIDGLIEEAIDRLEELRAELRAERISYGELVELQSLAEYIDADDVELRGAIGLEEY